MLRLSRTVPLPRWILVVALLFWCAIEAICTYLFLLNLRVTRELVRHSWSRPTVIVSVAGNRRREVARLYGADWRIVVPHDDYRLSSSKP